jgi:predicted transcriptional regulator
MKTTIEVSDDLLRRAKQQAAADGTTLRRVFEEALQRWLEEREQPPTGHVMRDGRFRGAGRTVDELDWDRIREDIDIERVFGR